MTSKEKLKYITVYCIYGFAFKTIRTRIRIKVFQQV